MVTWTNVVDKKVWSTGDGLRLYVENREERTCTSTYVRRKEK